MITPVPEFDYDELRLATDDFSASHILGKGSHGCVYKARLKSGEFVAVKRPSPGLDNSKLENEINVLSSLPQIHPNIVNFLGKASSIEAVMVMEFMPNGSLHDLLHLSSGSTTILKRVRIATQIARAVSFLHRSDPPIVHRDLKSANILFDSEWSAKLADFGLAVKQNQRVDSVSQPAGTMGYLDPSYTEARNLSSKTDVFSFGVVLLEILFSRKAIDVNRSPSSISDWALQMKPTTVVEAPWYLRSAVRRLLTVARKCVSHVDGDRPSIDAVLGELEESCVVVERPRFVMWSRFVGVVVELRKESGRTVVKRCGKNTVVAPRGKMLKELLDDVTVM